MQQLCLTGPAAAQVADRLFHALNIRPVGLRMEAFTVDGFPMGEAVRLLPPPAPGRDGVPCRIRITPERTVTVPAALEEVAAPGLLAALGLRAPLLLSGLSADVLGCPAFSAAVRACLQGDSPVVVTAEAAAVPLVQALTPPEMQLWFSVPQDEAGQAALLEALIPEAALRF